MHKPTQIAAHFILPNRTQAHPPPKNGRFTKLLVFILIKSLPVQFGLVFLDLKNPKDEVQHNTDNWRHYSTVERR